MSTGKKKTQKETNSKETKSKTKKKGPGKGNRTKGPRQGRPITVPRDKYGQPLYDGISVPDLDTDHERPRRSNGARQARNYGQWRPAFLTALRRMANIGYACKEAGVTMVTAYNHKQSDEAFAAEWEDAYKMGLEELEQRAIERAMQGSDSLMIFLLKTKKGLKEKSGLEITGADGRPIEIEQMEREERKQEVLNMIAAMKKQLEDQGGEVEIKEMRQLEDGTYEEASEE